MGLNGYYKKFKTETGLYLYIGNLTEMTGASNYPERNRSFDRFDELVGILDSLFGCLLSIYLQEKDYTLGKACAVVTRLAWPLP